DPVPNVMFVATPLEPVAAIDRVSPLRPRLEPARVLLTPPLRPRAARAAVLLLEMFRLLCAEPECSVMRPPEIDEAVVPLPVLPSAVSIAESESLTVPVMLIWLAPAAPETK